ncbi:hypothetical protein P886_4844 [Alteromonadaceae bacterium 2753L.S.0a.02]|nr:hypothetical protein P886_4844 [Alteromonadaceae bacterium 2753L.S.0a.02]
MKHVGEHLVETWIEELSDKLGKPPEVIRNKGLSASDFHYGSKVILSNPGELECTFHHAFSVLNIEAGKVAVFTEHTGYHEFQLTGMKVSDVVTEEYWDEEYRPG